jgi:hypothetical protein
MKSLLRALSVKAALLLFATGLTIFFAEAQAADWKEFTEATTGIFYYDAADLRSPSNGSVRVWIHNATKKETSLLELNCKNTTYRVLDVIQYDGAGGIKTRETYYDNPTPTWFNIEPNSVPRPLHSLVCR